MKKWARKKMKPTKCSIYTSISGIVPARGDSYLSINCACKEKISFVEECVIISNELKNRNVI
jgi:hypothetical protein